MRTVDGKQVIEPKIELLPRLTEPGECFHCRKKKKTKPTLIPAVSSGRGENKKVYYRQVELCATHRKERPPIHTQAQLAEAAASFRAWDRKAQRFLAEKKKSRMVEPKKKSLTSGRHRVMLDAAPQSETEQERE